MFQRGWRECAPCRNQRQGLKTGLGRVASLLPVALTRQPQHNTRLDLMSAQLGETPITGDGATTGLIARYQAISFRTPIVSYIGDFRQLTNLTQPSTSSHYHSGPLVDVPSCAGIQVKTRVIFKCWVKPGSDHVQTIGCSARFLRSQPMYVFPMRIESGQRRSGTVAGTGTYIVVLSLW